MNVNQYFSHKVIPDKKGKAYVVTENYSAFHQKVIGVFTGTETVLVINSGMGMNGDLRKYIECVLGTDKTIECVCLTGKPEDVGAASLFDAAYLSGQQMETYKTSGSDPEKRKELFARFSDHNEESIEYGDILMIDNSNVEFREAGDVITAPKPAEGAQRFQTGGEGYSFHLGGTVVEMASLPAQSEGQLVAVSPTCCIAFVGEAIDSVTHLEKLDREGLEKYADCLKKVIDYLLADTPLSEGMPKTQPVFYCGSSAVPMGEDVAENILAACQEVLDGKTEHDAPAEDKGNFRMHYVNNNCIIYDAEKIR